MNSSPAEYDREGGRRQPPARRSGRRRGTSETREAILAAARRQFAAHGYDRASLRGIAAEADVDQKLIAHFFGSKQQLFVVAAGLPLNPAETVQLVLAAEPHELRDRLADVIAGILDDENYRQRLTGFVRAAASEPEMARMLREFLTREVFAAIAAALDVEEPMLRANLVGSQIVGLVMARYVVGVEPLASLPGRTVAEAVAPTLERYLVGPLRS